MKSRETTRPYKSVSLDAPTFVRELVVIGLSGIVGIGLVVSLFYTAIIG